MARSKFPGKPSKPVNRTRINVLPSSTVEDESSLHLDTELKQVNSNNNINKLETNDKAFKNEISLNDNSRRIVKKKQICKSLMDRRNSITKLRRVISGTVNLNSQKLKSELNISQCISKNNKHSEQGLSNTRKLSKSKQSHIENSNLVGKFVLPSRSVHSSRVIKPNKRFLNVEAANSAQLRTFKKRVGTKKSNSLKSDSENTPYKSKCVSQYENNPSSKNMETSNRRIILRQARLQLHTQTPTGPEGPFSSSNNTSSVSPPGTVTCGVCGAVRFYRFVKQARKFNIYSCESCRKFISKMIKRQLCNKKLPDIQCLKGQGMCHVPPIVRSQQWKFRCAYKARCNACWLKMCLRSFQMPAVLKNNLTNLLPGFMKEPENLLNNSLSLFSFHTNLNNKNIVSKPIAPVSSNRDSQTESGRKRHLRKKIVTNAEKSNVRPPSNIKRQKLDLKGPRVKHVCRSASIVLGQPLAIFPNSANKKQTETSDSQNKSIQNENVSSQNIEFDSKENNFIDDDSSVTKLDYIEDDKEIEQPIEKIDTTPIPILIRQVDDKIAKHFRTNYSVETSKSRKRSNDVENGICGDYWENYDPEEICRSGFGLIASVSFPMLAICFLCGSAGQEQLLYCCSCCEPYHPFCLEQAPLNLHFNEQCYDWLCPRCTICTACGETDRQKINCQKCRKVYHPKCFNEWQTDDKLTTVCSSCLRCKSCGTNNITKFMGNTPLCLMCFKLRKKENFCPLCQKSYDDNDYNTEMMECGKCNMWIHAECERLSDEQYHILSLLPESIKFFCSICESVPYWRQAIAIELKRSFSAVLKLLSKNRFARDILKWSPISVSQSSSKSALSARRLQFSDESDCSDTSDNSDEEYDEENLALRNMRRKYKLKELRVSLKPYSTENDQVSLVSEDKSISKSPTSPSLTDIKNKLNSKEYFSLREFNKSMEEILKSTKSSELLEIYRVILKQVFPWYNPNENDILTDACFKTSNSDITKSEDNLSAVLDNSRYKLINNIENDTRICVLCKGVGDGLCYREGRLLYCGNDEWVHANCALWSSEVYEEIDGSLQNVHNAVSRGRLIKCSHCKQKGASIGCCAKSCHETYHFSCAHSVQCYFMNDKSIYCPSHSLVNNVAVISSPSDFIIRRSVYVELDKKRKRRVDSKKVQFMVGSLCVTNIGIVVPVVSDNAEGIIPSNLTCKRLFWSTIEPWKLVPYIITTRILNTETTNVITDRNFTIDHTLPKFIIDKKIKEILIWQKEIEKAGSAGGTDPEDDEEPQNENDILSPELTDAILEELPHEFLDGISMQDIFPKLMNNEELLGIDFKITDNSSTNDTRTNDTVLQFNEQNKKSSVVDDVKEVNDLISESKKDSKENKSEVFQQLQSKMRNHQRSCSVTLSCKPSKPIKAVPQDKNVYLQLLQVDGAYDNSSSSDSESMSQEIEDLWIPELSDEPVKCARCQCTYRTQASYKRHLESCEVMSTSESDSEATQDHERTDPHNLGIETVAVVEPGAAEATGPYVISSFESCSTYQTVQDQLHSSTSNIHTYVNAQSATEAASNPQTTEIFYSNVQASSEQKPSNLFDQKVSLSITQTQTPAITITQPTNSSVCESAQVTVGNTPASLSITQPTNQPNELCVNQSQPLYISQPSCNTVINQPNTISLVQSSSLPVTHAPISINPSGTISINTSATPIQLSQPMEIQSQQLTIQSGPITQGVTPVLNITPSNQITINAKMLPAQSIMTQAVTVPQSQIIKPVLKPAVVAPKNTRIRGRPRSLAIKKTRPIGSRTIFVPQNVSGTPPVIVQQLPTANVIPNFIEAFQQQTGQNLQYITTITPQLTSTLSAQPQIVQLQPEGTLVNLVSGVQPAVILSQPRVLSDQIIVDNNSSLVWAPQPVQPVFYGFETIVQNTVLQSQQFLPSTVPGMLTANSSYSSTTQVFQTSKLEPILDVTSGNIMLLNSGSVMNSQALPITQNVSNQISPSRLIISENKPSVSWEYVENNTNTAAVPAPPPPPPPPPPPLLESQTKPLPIVITTTNNNFNSNSINLPVSPFVSESGLPTNRVTPTPKLISTTAQSRPMSRVLPMPTNNSKQIKTYIKNTVIEKSATVQELNTEVDNSTSNKPPKITVLDEIMIKPVTQILSVRTDKIESSVMSPPPKEETNSLKLVFQKQNEGGLYKITNGFNTKHPSPVQVAPLKPIKTKNVIPQQLPHLEQNLLEKDKNINPSINNKSNTKFEQKLPQEKQENSMLYTVEAQDGFHYSSTSLSELWSKIFDAVQAARIAHNMSPLPQNSFNVLNSLQIIGLKSNGLRYLVEQLPGAGRCVNYKPSFHIGSQEVDTDEDFELIHPSGAAATRPYVRSHEPSDMFGWLASKHRKPPLYNSSDFEQNTRRGAVTNLPMPMRFRQLKLTFKQSVGVYRSKIHKRGLFCHRDIESAEMVIEYAGEVIRSVLADKREKQYTAKGMGCYMFRIDENFVVDATMKGNAARFINHSCEPNCYSKVVEILGHKHIIIFALRKIACGEELTYDYKFPFEEDKIPCTCGSRRCRKFLN